LAASTTAFILFCSAARGESLEVQPASISDSDSATASAGRLTSGPPLPAAGRRRA
jgi:hypothetical protein